MTSAEATKSTCWLAAAALADGPTLTCCDTGAPGWSNSSTRALSRQIPSTAASTTSVGSIYSASTFQVNDGAQCGGTGGGPELCMLTPDQQQYTYNCSTLLGLGLSPLMPGPSFIYTHSWSLLTPCCNKPDTLRKGGRK